MDEEYGGGLTDILRINGEAMNPENGESSDMNIINDCWQFESSNPLIIDDFGDPFSDFHQDPLLHDDHIQTDQDSRLIFNDNNLSVGDHQDLLIRRPANNLFGRMLQISTNTKLLVSESPREAVAVAGGALKSPMLVVNDMINSRPKVEINAGIKRRKSQVKKVVCVPATAPSSSSNKPMSEVVPSDLWAWRKYGQKPIKGSPYPRSYYRCSRSKGCPARKQVERSRTDLNTLVITYTCEHNHPWPTQRNALASSTRTIQSSKNSSNSKSNSLITQSQKAGAHSSHDVNQTSVTTTGNSSISHYVKIKEMEEDHNKPTEIEHEEFFDVFPQSYRPVLAQAADKSEDFFADLGELEADPMNLLFSHGYSEVEAEENKSLDPFTFYEWAGSSREDKKGS